MVAIDYLGFPHIFEAILDASSLTVLAAIGATSRFVRAQVQARELAHLSLSPGDGCYGIKLSKPDGSPFACALPTETFLPTEPGPWQPRRFKARTDPAAIRKREEFERRYEREQREIRLLLKYIRRVDIRYNYNGDLAHGGPDLLEEIFKATCLDRIRITFSRHEYYWYGRPHPPAPIYDVHKIGIDIFWAFCYDIDRCTTCHPSYFYDIDIATSIEIWIAMANKR
jgi:hypothetical protein